MGKRQRDSGMDSGMDSGISPVGPFLSLAKAPESRGPLQGNDDNGVVPPRKKQNTQQTSGPSRTDVRNPAYEHEDLQIAQNLYSGAEGDNQESKSSTRNLNPFSTNNRGIGDEREVDQTDVTGSLAASGGETDSKDTRAGLIPPSERNDKLHEQQSDSRPPQKLSRKKGDQKSRDYPSIHHADYIRLNSQVTINNLQALVLNLLADGPAPQWVAITNKAAIQQVVVLLVPGLDSGMFTGEIDLDSAAAEAVDSTMSETPEDDAMDVEQPEHLTNPKRLGIRVESLYPAKLKEGRLPEVLRPLSKIFPRIYLVQGAADHSGRQINRIHSPIQSMLTSSIPKTREERKMKKDKRHKGPLPQTARGYLKRPTPIAAFLADLGEQKENEYTIHPAWFLTPEAKEAELQRRVKAKTSEEYGWVDSHVESLEDGKVPESEIEKGSTTAGREILAVDCEMCKVEGEVNVLARISVVNWDGEKVLDTLVKPDVPIVDYATQWSGITEAMLKDVTTTLSDVQKELLKLLTPRTILVGHSLNMDLNVLKLTHPFVIDTGFLYPHPRGTPYKHGLKFLTQKYLHREIQDGTQGHDSVEDAMACLDLVKQKCEHGPEWGTSDMNAESIFKRLGRATRKSKAGGTQEFRKGAIVDWGYPERGVGSQAAVAIGCQSDQEVVRKITSTTNAQGDVDDTGTGTEVDFVWGRLRELELVRGWWDKARTDDVESIRAEAAHRLQYDGEDVTGPALGAAVARTVENIEAIYDSLPKRTAFIVYSGTGDPREIGQLQAMRRRFQEEYKVKKWDELSVKWTDTEVQALSRACNKAREGIAFVTVKI